jgi:hypothetical protein
MVNFNLQSGSTRKAGRRLNTEEVWFLYLSIVYKLLSHYFVFLSLQPSIYIYADSKLLLYISIVYIHPMLLCLSLPVLIVVFSWIVSIDILFSDNTLDCTEADRESWQKTFELVIKNLVKTLRLVVAPKPMVLVGPAHDIPWVDTYGMEACQVRSCTSHLKRTGVLKIKDRCGIGCMHATKSEHFLLWLDCI